MTTTPAVAAIIDAALKAAPQPGDFIVLAAHDHTLVIGWDFENEERCAGAVSLRHKNKIKPELLVRLPYEINTVWLDGNDLWLLTREGVRIDVHYVGEPVIYEFFVRPTHAPKKEGA